MTIRSFISVLLGLCPVLGLAAPGSGSDKINGLLNNSPFGASRSNAVAGQGTGDPYEFRSVLEENGSKLFSIYDTATHRSVWVEMNDAVNGFSVKGYDAAHDTVTLEFHEKSLTLPIKRAPAVPQAMQPAPQPGGAGAVANTAGPNQISPLDQQRLQQVQEEIRRRRALRQQPAVPVNAAGVPIGGEGGPRPMPVNANGQESGPQLMPSRPGAPAGPQLLPSGSPNAQSGPLPLPVKN
jgi:hypothetical protein